MQILAAPFSPAGDYQSIATTTVGVGGQATITFSSIPSSYKHLQIRYSASSNRATFVDNLVMKINSNTGTNYANHIIYGDGASVAVSALSSQTSFTIFTQNLPGANQTNFVGVNVIDFLDYSSTNKFKTFRSLTGLALNSADSSGSFGRLQIAGGVYLSSSAITTIELTVLNGTAFGQYSSFALYGIKG